MPQLVQSAVDAVRYAHWLTRERLLRWGKVCAVLSIVLLAWDAAVHPATGVINGRDFFEFWSNTVLAIAGRAEAVYVAGPHHTLDQSLTYPPVMMLLCRPLAALSYDEALLLWGALGVALFAWSLSRLVGWPMAAVATIGAPAAFWNLLSGQNGYFTAVLLVWGLMLVERRPVSAGILLGTLCYKPQLVILVPVALAAGGCWRAFRAAALWVAILIIASVIVFGPDAWIGFFDRVMLQRQLMEVAALSWTRMPTVFAMMRLLDAGLAAAYLMQGLSAVAAAFAVGALWRGRCPLGIKAAGLAVGVFLATPHAWDYDTVVLVFAAAWLAKESVETGFQSWEKIAVVALLTLPALSFGPARLLGLQIAPVLLWLTMAVLLRRGLVILKPVFVAASAPAPDRDARVPV